MAQHTFKNGTRRSTTTIASSEVKATESTSNSASLELISGRSDASVDPGVLAKAVVAASRNSMNASKLLRTFARNASPVQATLANLFRANATFRTRTALKTVAASLSTAQSLEPAAADRFLTRLGLHLIATEAEAAIEPALARRLLALAGVALEGSARESAARALTADSAYAAEFQGLIVSAAVQAGRLVAAENEGVTLSLRARVGYAGPRHQRRASPRRPRAVVRAAERALALVGAGV